MCAGKHASLGICVRGNNKLGETRIPATLGLICVGYWQVSSRRSTFRIADPTIYIHLVNALIYRCIKYHNGPHYTFA